MSTQQNQRAKEILRTIRYATVATVTPDGKPWNSPLAYEVDIDYNIYWFSDKESQHSKNIRTNPSAFIVVYDTAQPEGTGEGVYIEANVVELEGAEEINRIRNMKKNAQVNDAANFLGDSVRRCYRATPKRIWMNDYERKNGKFVRDYRVEIDLK